jgi:hypothetical protein
MGRAIEGLGITMAKQTVKQGVAPIKGATSVEKSESSIDKTTLIRMQKDFDARFNETDLKDIKLIHKQKCPDGNPNGTKKDMVLDLLGNIYSKTAMKAFREHLSVAPAKHVEPAPEKAIPKVKKVKKETAKPKSLDDKLAKVTATDGSVVVYKKETKAETRQESREERKRDCPHRQESRRD